MRFCPDSNISANVKNDTFGLSENSVFFIVGGGLYAAGILLSLFSLVALPILAMNAGIGVLPTIMLVIYLQVASAALALIGAEIFRKISWQQTNGLTSPLTEELAPIQVLFRASSLCDAATGLPQESMSDKSCPNKDQTRVSI